MRRIPFAFVRTSVLTLLLVLTVPILALSANPGTVLAKPKPAPVEPRLHMFEQLPLLAAGKGFFGIDPARPLADAVQRVAPLGDRWTASVEGDALLLTLSERNTDGYAKWVPSMRLEYAGDRLRAAEIRIRTLYRDWAASVRYCDARLTDLAGRSSRLGVVYETNLPGVRIAIPHADSLTETSVIVVLWTADGSPAGTEAAGEWTAWSAVGPAARAAFDAGDYARARAALATFDSPLAGSGLVLREALCARDPEREYPALAARIDTLSSWGARLQLLKDIRVARERAQAFAKALQGGAVLNAPPVDVESRRAVLRRIAEKALPAQYEAAGAFRLVQEAAIRKALGIPLDPEMAQKWVAPYRPWVSNLADHVARRPYWGGQDPYEFPAIGHWGAHFDNIYVDGRPAAALEVGEIDMSDVVSEASQRTKRKGAWVTASEAELAEQAQLEAAPDRLRAIDAELRALDTTPVGQQVQGSDPGVRQYVHVDEAGRTSVTEVSAGVRSVYVKGVREDLKWRNQRRTELKAERERLLALRGRTPAGVTVFKGKVWRSDAGDEVAEDGRMYEGVIRRPFRLKGTDVDVTVEQVAKFFRFVPADEANPQSLLHREAEARLDELDHENIFGWKPVAGCPTALIRLATFQLVERAARANQQTPPDALEMDLQWARGILEVGKAPSKALLDWTTYDLPK